MKKITLLFIFTITTAFTMLGQQTLFSRVNQEFNDTNWVNSYAVNYEYDSNGNLIEELGFSWNATDNVWEKDSKTIRTFNTFNKSNSRISYNWNSSTNQFDENDKAIYTYDGSGNLIEEIYGGYWNAGNFEYDSKYEFEYTNNILTKTTWYDYDESIPSFVESYVSTYTYNGNNKVTSILQVQSDINVTPQQRKDSYVYDTNNNLTKAVYESLDGVGSSWVEESNIVYTYDSNGNRTKFLLTQTSSEGVYVYKEDYVFDTTALLSNFHHPFNDDTGLNNFPVGFGYYNKILSTEDDYYKTTYNYQNAIVLAVEDFKLAENKIKVFPNPTSSSITIESSRSNISNVELYNTFGSKVFSSKKSTFNIDFLNTGVYFLNITSDDGNTVTRKIVKN